MSKFLQILLVFLGISILWHAQGAQYEAREAHRHTHELGCAMNYEPLCKWHGHEERP